MLVPGICHNINGICQAAHAILAEVLVGMNGLLTRSIQTMLQPLRTPGDDRFLGRSSLRQSTEKKIFT